MKIQACGVCHTDLHYLRGRHRRRGPFLLGHEAAGVVESVGEGVTEVDPGDFVVLNWRCPRPWALGAFIEKTLATSGQCTKVDPQAPAAAAGLPGCGVMAGFGAAVNAGGVGRGDSIAVIGCGGVGNAAIAGAALAGASTIIAIDVDDRKPEWPKGFGATHSVFDKMHRGEVLRSVVEL